MHVVPEPANILAALICALEQPHTITERGGVLFIEPPPSADEKQFSPEASVEAVNAVAYATNYHPEWFCRGAQHAKKVARKHQRQPE